MKPRTPPSRPTHAMKQAAYNSQRPLGMEAVAYVRKKPVRFREDAVGNLDPVHNLVDSGEKK